MTEDNSEAREALLRDLAGHVPPEYTQGLIGRFFLEFSHIEHMLRTTLARMLRLPADIGNAVTAPYDFMILCNVYTVVLEKRYGPQADALLKTLKEVRALNDHRVRIAHGTWGYGSDAPRIANHHTSRQSLKSQWYYAEAGELEQIVDRAARLRKQSLDQFVDLAVTSTEKWVRHNQD